MLEENLAGGTVMGLMRRQGGWGPLLESRGSQLALFAQKKRYCVPGSLRQSSARTLGAQDLFAYVLLPWERTHLSCHWHR